MIKRIEIAVVEHRYDENGDAHDVDAKTMVWAWVDGAFAIHKGIGPYTSDQSPRHWVLTHLPTQGMIKASLDKAAVIKMMQEMKGWHFAGRPFEELPACDIVEFRNEIIKANKPDELIRVTAEKYEEEIKPYFYKLLNCREAQP